MVAVDGVDSAGRVDSIVDVATDVAVWSELAGFVCGCKMKLRSTSDSLRRGFRGPRSCCTATIKLTFNGHSKTNANF